MLDKVINVRLLSHPLNWLIVWSVLLIAAALYTTVAENIVVNKS